MEPSTPTVSLRFLRTPEGTIYGPVDMATLCLWAADARVIPGCELSADRKTWFPVESLPELRLNWSVRFDESTTYGPLNLLAIWTLASEQSIPRGVKLEEQGTDRVAVLDDSLLPLLVDECRGVLAGCGTYVADSIGKLGGAHKAALAGIAERDARLEELQAKLEQAELSVSRQEKALAEAQKRIADLEVATARTTALENDMATLRIDLEGTRLTLADRETQLESTRIKLGKAESDLDVNLKLVSETQRCLAEVEARKDNETITRLKDERDAAATRVTTLENDLTALRADLEGAQHTLAERESQLDVMRVKLDQTENDLASKMELLTEVQRRLSEYEARKDDETITRLNSELELSRQALEAERERFKKEEETASQLKAEVGTLTRQLEEGVAGLKVKDTLIGDQKKALQETRQKAETLTSQLGQAREALAKAQKAGRAAEQKMKDDMVSIQRDLNALMMASRCVKQVKGEEKVKPVAIDWVGMGTPGPDASHKGDDVEARFARLTLNEKFMALQKELQASAEEKEVMRRDLENVRGRYAYLQSESSRKEKESAEKLAQIQKEIKTSSELLARTMEEIEKRESQLREMRKKTGGGVADGAGASGFLDAEVIHAEVLGPEEGGAPAPIAEEPAARPGPSAKVPPRGHRVLNTVEVQLQRELKEWEALKREQENKGGTFSKWFRRKKS